VIRFGSSDILDDGRDVISEWLGTRLWIGAAVKDLGRKLVFLRSIMAHGAEFTVGTDQNLPIIVLVRGLAEKQVTVGASAGNNAAVIREVTEGVEVGWMSSSTRWNRRIYTRDLEPVAGSDRSGPCANTSQGIIDFADDGSLIISASPIDRPCGTSPYLVRLGVTRQNGTLSAGQAADGRLPDGLIMSRAGVAGTLAHGQLIEEPRFSRNGRHWIGRLNALNKMALGTIPATGVPPLVLATPPTLPPIKVTPPTRLIWRGLDATGLSASAGWSACNVVWGWPKSTPIPKGVKIVEGMPWAREYPDDADFLGILIGTEKGHAPYPSKQAQYDACRAEAKRRHCAMVIYADANEFTALAEAWADDAERHGLTVVRTLRPYPPITLKQIETEVKRIKPRGQLGFMVPLYTIGGTATEKQIERVLTDTETLARKHPEIKVDLGFGGGREDGSPRAVDGFVRQCRAMPAGTPPSLLPDPGDGNGDGNGGGDPMTKKLTVALRRDYATPRYLSVTDDRRHVDARLTDWHDPRTHFALFVLDEPGSGLPPNTHGAGNKMFIRSAQDQVGVYPNSTNLDASLTLFGQWEIRAGEFPSTWDYLLPAEEQAITVFENGRVAIMPYKSDMWSRHGFAVIDVKTGKQVHGPF